MKYQGKILFLLPFFLLLFFLFNHFNKINIVEIKVPFYTTYLTRMDINDKIKEDKDLYVKLYSDYFKRPDIAKEVIKAALELEMPINTCFAVGLAESNLDHSIKPNTNKNGSFDYGVFRLNSQTYPDVKTFSKLENNVRQGILHLKDEYKKYNSFDIAIITYNSGSVNNIGNITVKHLNRVLQYEKELDEWFNSKYWSTFNRSVN